MYFLVFIHIAFLPFRQIESFLRKISEFVPKMKSTDYSTVCKRLKRLEVNLSRKLDYCKRIYTLLNFYLENTEIGCRSSIDYIHKFPILYSKNIFHSTY
ncbi:MAG: hypothetical protein DRN25_03200 [Thermoplasmata archaeon]|nr:MAG: hypothetical protein DRN18_03790 [Thermoplasmata archaeon]RLF60186.1 MAG: hypothetical protein DRN25_03200 [Thermoplasmata archaeon]